jgi:N-acetylglucosamine kinase-like BadF-type ATPase
MRGGFFFGIDGGGTHSRLAIINSAQKVLARVTAGSTNIYSVSQEAVFENLTALLNDGLQEAGL